MGSARFSDRAATAARVSSARGARCRDHPGGPRPRPRLHRESVIVMRTVAALGPLAPLRLLAFAAGPSTPLPVEAPAGAGAGKARHLKRPGPARESARAPAGAADGPAMRAPAAQQRHGPRRARRAAPATGRGWVRSAGQPPPLAPGPGPKFPGGATIEPRPLSAAGV